MSRDTRPERPSPGESTESDDRLLFLREQVLQACVVTGIVGGAVAVVPSLVLSYREGLWGLGAANLAALLTAVGLQALRRRIAYVHRSVVMLGLVYGLGLSILGNAGVLSGGPLVLFSFAVFAALLLGLRAAAVALALNAVTLAVVFVTTPTGDAAALPYFVSTPRALTAGATFLMLDAAASVSVAVLVDRLHSFVQQASAAQASQRESEERFRTLIANIPGAFLRCCPDEGRTALFVSPAIQTITGLPAEAYTAGGVRLRDAVASEDLPEVARVLARAQADRRAYSVEYRMRDSAGQLHWVLERGRPVPGPDGQVAFVDAVLFDTSDRRHAEEALRASEAEYRALVQSANSIILRLDPAGTTTFVNEFAERFFGCRAQDVVGRPAQGTLLPAGAEGDQTLRLLLSEGAEPVETPQARPDRKPGWVAWTRRARRDASGEVVEMLCVGHDVSDRRELEVRLRQSQKLEAIGTLAGGIAHDFNNLLAAIVACTEMAREDAPPESEARVNLDEVLVASRRARDLVRQILTFSRRAGDEAAGSSAEAGPVVEEAVRLLRASLPRSVTVTSRLAAPGVRVAMDATLLHQVVMNLATNAARAMPEGGDLALELEGVAVAAGEPEGPRDLLPGYHLRLRVRDTGLGMTPAVLERIFEPYFSTRPVGEGSGLGLAVVHGIVQRHRGAITVRSEPGRGAEFEVWLPAEPGPAPLPLAPPPAPPASPRGKERVLVVDDEPAIAAVVERMLGRLGYVVQTAANGRQALDLLERAPGGFDLVLSDVTMPELTGDQLAAEVGRRWPRLPVLLCTGYHDGSQPEPRAGPTLLLKPLTIVELSTAVRRALDQ